MINKMFKIALSQYGISELENGDFSGGILKYFDDLDFINAYRGLDWCSVFVMWCYKQAFYEVPKNKKRLIAARNWQHVGVKIEKPEMGDVVVFWRESKLFSWRGHVGFFVNYSQCGKFVNVLGGNQGRKVCISSYPVDKVLSYNYIPIDN